jgi:hypothetical protein
MKELTPFALLITLLFATQTQGQQSQQQAQNQSQQQQTQPQAQQPSQNQQEQQTQLQIQSPAQNQIQQQQNAAYPKVGPHWQIGTTWRVETTNLQRQSTMQRQSKPVVWIFTVVGESKIVGRDCYEVVIQCQEEADRQPHISIWLDRASGMLMRVTTKTLVRGQWRTLTETFAVPEGKSVAVLGTVPSLPLDMPLFTAETGSKDIDGMTYEIVTGTKGAKNLGEVGFTCKIEQTIKPVSDDPLQVPAGAKALGGTINLKDAVEVELKNGSTKRVRQLWLPGKPWAIYSTNGVSESRLLDVTLPQPPQG